jgi:hypothetical protein
MRVGSRSLTRRAGLGVAVAVTLVAFLTENAGAVAATGEYPGPTTDAASAAEPPTAEKPESKLWFTDGTWWSVMISGSGGHKIFRLNPDSQVWTNTGVVVDTRTNTHVDVLFSGSTLYVASHVFDADGGSAGGPSRLYRFSYDAGTDRYTLLGSPQTINSRNSETLVIAKDSVGRLWATWTQGTEVWANRTTGGDVTWGTPFKVSGDNAIATDDISSVIAYGGNRIGIMWSDQAGTPAFRFISRADSTTSTTAFSAVEVAKSGSGIADDHINLKTDSSGRIFAAVKTSTDPQVLLLIRAAGGGWTSRTFGREADDHTRPIVLIYERQENSRLFVFAATRVDGPRHIYFKETSLDNPSFPTGAGTAAIDGAEVNDPTSTKGNLTDTTDLLVQASGETGGNYRHFWKLLPK